jgi:hypothetical protein
MKGGRKNKTHKSKIKNRDFRKTPEFNSIGILLEKWGMAHFVRRNVRSGNRTHHSH